MKVKHLIVVSLVFSFLFTGCKVNYDDVPKAKYDALVEDYNSVVSERDELRRMIRDKDAELYKSEGNGGQELSQEEADITATTASDENESRVFSLGDSFEINGMRITVDDMNAKVYEGWDRCAVVKFTAENLSDESIADTDWDIAYKMQLFVDNKPYQMGDAGLAGRGGALLPGTKTTFSHGWYLPDDAGLIELIYEYTEEEQQREIKIIVK